MIRGISGQGSVQVIGGSVSQPHINSTGPLSGQVRYHNGNFEIFDGTIWHTFQSNYSSIGLDPQTELILAWAKKKMQEEEMLLSLPGDHPAIKAAKENVNRAKQILKEAEEQLKVTQILSEEQCQTCQLT